MQADQNLRWAHLSESTFSDVVAHLIYMTIVNIGGGGGGGGETPHLIY